MEKKEIRVVKEKLHYIDLQKTWHLILNAELKRIAQNRE